jgi:EAL domain-containing protein (putative c-di-GMP-specific phosphodiesterase class I)
VAEETGLIALLGERVLSAATRAASGWIALAEWFRISVNVSPRELERADFLARTERVLAHSGLPPAHLMLEVTESTLLSGDARTRENLDGIARAGIGIALDAFGTGSSSLSHLCHAHVDVIKVARGFIAEPAGDAIIAAVASFGSHAGIEVLADGVEVHPDRARVQRLGCALGQGWYFGGPLPAAGFKALLEGQSSDSSMNPIAVARDTASARVFTPSFR